MGGKWDERLGGVTEGPGFDGGWSTRLTDGNAARSLLLLLDDLSWWQLRPLPDRRPVQSTQSKRLRRSGYLDGALIAATEGCGERRRPKTP